MVDLLFVLNWSNCYVVVGIYCGFDCCFCFVWGVVVWLCGCGCVVDWFVGG